jgi:hypothetical protein
MHFEHGILMVWLAAILALTACSEKEISTGAVVAKASMDVVTPTPEPKAIEIEAIKPIAKPKPSWMGDSCYVVPGCIAAIRELEREWNR